MQEMTTLKEEHDEEKATYMQQVSRVKSETLTLVQKESENEMQKDVTAAIADRDRYWQDVINKTEDQNAKDLAAKVTPRTVKHVSK